MALTRVAAAGINTGQTFVLQNVNTSGIVTAGTVQVGSATTIHSAGIDLGGGNITSHNINSTGIITATGGFVGAVTGNVTGNLTGNVTGNVTGDLTGDVTGDLTGNVTGNVTGNLTGTATTASSLSGTPNVIVGVLTATDAVINGNLTVQGTTTTLDTTLTEVDKLEVGANNATVGVAITQSGTGDILRLYDGASQVVTVTAGGNLNITGVSTFQNNVHLLDSDSLYFGAGNDLRILHDGANSYIKDDGTGNLFIQSNGSSVTLQSTSGSNFAEFVNGGAVNLYHNNSKKFETTGYGVSVTGDARVTGILTVGQNSTTINGALEYPSIRPTLDLNFAATKTLDRRITFTRDGVGTYVDDMGIIKYASNNTPRFDHDPVTGESLGLLIEEARTNYCGNSEMLANWSLPISDTFIASSGTQLSTNPDGSSPAYHYVPSTTSGLHRFNRTVTLPTLDTDYVVSLFVKRVTAGSVSSLNRYIELETTGSWAANSQGTGHSGSNGGTSVTFDLQDLAIQSKTNNTDGYTGDAKIEDYGNGWYRLSYVFNPGSGSYFTGTVWWGHPSTLGPDGSNSGNGNPSFYFWGASVEKGAFITSHIPTHTNSSVTRTADIAKITGTNFTDFYNQTEGTVLLNVDSVDGGTNMGLVSFDDTTTSNYLSIQHSLTPKSYFVTRTSSSNLYGVEFSTWESGQRKLSFAYKTNDFAMTENGSTPTTVGTGSIPSVTQMNIGSLANNNSLRIKQARFARLTYYNKRLPNAQLQGLTAQ